jgi:hypothetical protein
LQKEDFIAWDTDKEQLLEAVLGQAYSEIRAADQDVHRLKTSPGPAGSARTGRDLAE